MNENNPLRQYFRQPAIYIELPSQGKFYPPEAIDIPPTGKFPVYPMTAIDEITYRTPDALVNGQATVNVIQSCVPNIKDAWKVPSMDIDTLLVSIRIASYGHNMEFVTECPKCQNISDQAIDLRYVLESIKPTDYTKTIKSGDMEIFFRPMTYQNMSDNNNLQFQNQKILQQLPDSAASDNDKMTLLSKALKDITEITIKALSQSIGAVKTPNALVSEPEFIEGLLKNCDRNLFNQIRDYIISNKAQSEMQPFHLSCPKCTHEYEQAITLDMSSFFEPAS
jgi:hypothetical protein